MARFSEDSDRDHGSIVLVGFAPDAISFSFIGVTTLCTAAPTLPLFPMTGGQVTVD